MKRLREDGFSGSQFKRPCAASRVESNRTGGREGQRLTTDDALQYLNEVKDMFQDQREKYDRFLEVMKDFKAQRIDTDSVIKRVKELFKGHNNLIYGFNTFLPKGYEITLDDDDAAPKKAAEFEEAINFVNKIKRHFQNDDHVYKSFLDILNLYRKEHKNIGEVYKEVSQLFEGHPGLLDEFTRFLPNNSSAASGHRSQHGQSTFQHYDERNTEMPASRQMIMNKQQWRQNKFSSSHADCNVSVELPDLEDKAILKIHEDPKKHEKDTQDRRNHDQDDRDREHNSNRDSNIQRSLDKRKPSWKDRFGAMESTEDKGALKSMYNQEFIFCQKVKEKLGDSDDYQAFLKCLHIYSTEIINRNELKSLVVDLLAKYPDLMNGFDEFLERCENIDGFLAGVMSRKSLWNDGNMPRSMKVDGKDKELKHDAEGAKEKDRNKEKYMGKSIQELDLSNCERCTPSYRLLPDDYSIATASQRSEIGVQVLNDYWVSVTSGSEDYSFKHMRRNQYEESLFRCEDDRFELDMLLESVNSTAKRAEDLWTSLNSNTINADGPIRIEDYFTTLNLRCIERLYGDHGLDVIEILRRNSVVALPAIITRLKQKQDEWTKCRSDFNKVWAEIYAKNLYKSLDHRSFYFKQQDSKNLSSKSLVAEIKEIKANLQKEDDVLLAVTSGNKKPLSPHLSFEYTDIDIHEDLYKLVRFSSHELYRTKEQSNKIMRLWTTFLEPMLGVPSQLHRTDGADDIVKAVHHVAGNSASGVGENDGSPVSDANANSKVSKYVGDGDQISSAKVVNSSTAARELDAGDSHSIRRDDYSAHVDKSKNDVGSSEKVPEQHISHTASPVVGSQNSHGKTNVELASGSQSTTLRPLHGAEDSPDAITNSDSVRPSKDADSSQHVTDAAKVNRYLGGPIGRSKIEKDGELSPNGHFEEDHSVIYGDRSLQDIARAGDGEDARVDNDADADDEDSENASEAGNEVSVSESAGDECSREEQVEDDVEQDELDDKAERDGEADGNADAHYNERDGAQLSLSEQYLITVKPLAKFVTSAAQSTSTKGSRVYYGNDNFYTLFRLHHTLYERILAAKVNSISSETKWRNSKDPSLSDPYASFMRALYDLLQGLSDNARFEDDCRAIVGNQSYVLFTLDKLIFKLIKQLQTIVSDEMDNKLIQLFEYGKSRKPGRFADSVYHENAHVLLHDENIYRIECSSAPARLLIQLMDSGHGHGKPEVIAVSIDPSFSAYLHNEFLSVVSNQKEHHRIMLKRNRQQYAALDDISAMSLALDGAQIVNGLECKISCNSSKISYVLDTEDFFFRPRKRRRNLPVDLPA